jgi:asparaginyl-tRNA synthetase
MLESRIDGSVKSRLLRLTSQRAKAILKVRNTITHQLRNLLHDEGFVEIPCPTLGVCIDDFPPFECFRTTYFGNKLMLSTSSQLYMQTALLAFDKVWSLMPVFRQERHANSNHLPEFWYLHLEMADRTKDDLIRFVENLILKIVSHSVANLPKQLKLAGRIPNVPQTPFIRVPFHEVFGTPKSFRRFQKLEKTLVDKKSREFKDPFWITNWPSHIKKEWYYSRDLNDPRITKAVDLIYPGGFGEAVSGGERENSYDRVLRRMDKRVLNRYKWYLEAFKLGIPPHSGCGLGIERLVRWMCGFGDIQESVLFPRDRFTFIP